ncbi:MAG: hypothetical protein ACLUE8_02795 [Lachnospiraceae bacterium]
MEVWNPMLWEFSRVMRECHRKIGAMLGKNKPPVGQAPIMGLLRTQDGLTQEEVSERLQRNETSVALAVERLVQEGYLTFEGEALHLTDAGQAEAARTVRAMEETEKLALQGFYGRGHRPLHSLLERMHRNLQGKAPSGEQKPRLEY